MVAWQSPCPAQHPGGAHCSPHDRARAAFPHPRIQRARAWAASSPVTTGRPVPTEDSDCGTGWRTWHQSWGNCARGQVTSAAGAPGDRTPQTAVQHLRGAKRRASASRVTHSAHLTAPGDGGSIAVFPKGKVRHKASKPLAQTHSAGIYRKL